MTPRFARFAAVLILAAASAALASRTRLRLERIAPGEDGKTLVYASIVELEGNVVDDRGAAQFQLKVNGHSAGRAEKAARFVGAGEPLEIVLVVESSALYGPQKVVVPPPPPPPPKKTKGKKPAKGKTKTAPPPAPTPPTVVSGDQPLEKVKDAVKGLLEALPAKSQVLVIDYGGQFTLHPPFRNAPSAANEVDGLDPDDESGDLTLIDAVSAALRSLNNLHKDEALPAARRLIVVISDGLNSTMDRKTFRALGDTAAKAHVPIHTIAYSPTDERGPLLNLGEISKRSNGTFRWARTADDLRAQVETLGDEVNKQYVLTFKIDPASLQKKKLTLVSDDLESNVLSYGEIPAAPFRWGLWLIVAAAALGVGGVILRIATRPKMRFATNRAGGQPRQTAAPQQPRQTAAPERQFVAPAQHPTAAAAQRGVIIVVSGALAGQRFAVGAAPLTVGKGPSALQITDDPTVSTRHAQLALDRGMFVLTDLGSTNGTFVNNQRVTQPVRLSDGDLVRFGNTQIKFRTE